MFIIKTCGSLRNYIPSAWFATGVDEVMITNSTPGAPALCFRASDKMRYVGL